MLETLRISFTLKNTYRVNAILHGLKRLPLIKRLLPADVYRVHWLKVFATVISVIWELFKAFWGKFFYLLVMIFLPTMLIPMDASADVFLHILLFLTVVGGILNAYLFETGMDKYYALILLKMNAKQYTLINFGYALLKLVVGMLVFGLIFGLMSGLTAWQCVLIPFFVMAMKLIYAAYDLRRFERIGTAASEIPGGNSRAIVLMVLLAFAYGLPLLKIAIPAEVSMIVMGLTILSGIFCVHKILKFNDYRLVYQRVLNQSMFQMEEAKVSVTETSRGKIAADTRIISEKKGFEYLNELFVKRHRKILWKKAKWIGLVSLAVIVIAQAGMLFFPQIKQPINAGTLRILPIFAFVLYAINGGTEFTQALFVNCDHSLLTYSFYKQPESVLKLFTIRLREIIKVNLFPAGIIAVGMALILFASGGTDNPLNYVVILASIICMSIFFSVHYLTIYYLLQPYNAGTEIKSGTYQIVLFLTYFVCYMLIQAEMTTLAFGIMAIVFCVLYCVVACVLVYKFAPKTFRIRN